MMTSVNVTGRRGREDPRAIAAQHWAEIPDWVSVVADECWRSTNVAVAERLGYKGGSVISQVLRADYPGDIAGVEARVRGAFMGLRVDCPALDGMDIPRDRCLREQEMPRTTASPQRMRFYRTCRSGCPHSRIKGVDDAAL